MNLKKELLSLSFANVSINKIWKYLSLKENLDFNHFDDFISFLASHSSYLQVKQSQIDLIKKLESDGVLNSWFKNSIAIGESDYPKMWYQLPQPPLLIYYQGSLDLLDQPLITIIGTRRVTDYGRQACQEIVSACIDQGWVCVSGMAKGIDTIVHKTSLSKQDGSTIAIIPTGLNHTYPIANIELQACLSQKHLVISEFAPSLIARKHHFIMRNRLLAGISPVTIIIEAAKKSGSLITANYALQANREIFALPGRITDSQAFGCNQLIEAGARPIISIENLINDIHQLFIYQEYSLPSNKLH